MRKAIRYFSFFILFFIVSSWQTEKELATINVSISQDGVVKLDNYSILNPITNYTLDSILGESKLVKINEFNHSKTFIYKETGLFTQTAPLFFDNELQIRYFTFYFNNPKHESIKNKFNGNLNILGHSITEGTKFSELINDTLISKFLIFYLGDYENKTQIELKIHKAYLSIRFNSSKTDTTLASIAIEPFMKHAK